MQATHTAHGIDLAAIAAGSGFAASETIRDMTGVAALTAKLTARQGPIFAQIKIAADTNPLVLPPRDGPLLKNRFRAALLGPRAAAE
jgi:phosphonopyruvate decarboxylase